MVNVAPRTATVLAAGLLAVAVIPVAAGLTGDAYQEPAVFAVGFTRATLISAALAAAGGLIAGPPLRPAPACPEEGVGAA